ncbi:hypothetical protein BD770DRAFT_406534 [Pilaira anomala]|nr:hypothetical protein BD770DRAFT_406534 [Pilaira anomala]
MLSILPNKYQQKIGNDRQIVEFINCVFRPHVEFSPDSPYMLDYVCDKEILGVDWAFTKKLDKTTSLAFSKWLNKQNVDFLSERKYRCKGMQNTIMAQQFKYEMAHDNAVIDENSETRRAMQEKTNILLEMLRNP